MKLPTAIAAYLTAEQGDDDEALTKGFAADAVVTDEGARHSGHSEIRAWRLAANAKYPNLVTEPVEQIAENGRVTIRCKVSGDFPGSPAMLDFAFTLAGGLISALEIH